LVHDFLISLQDGSPDFELVTEPGLRSTAHYQEDPMRRLMFLIAAAAYVALSAASAEVLFNLPFGS
jgi:hypothetical protein